MDGLGRERQNRYSISVSTVVMEIIIIFSVIISKYYLKNSSFWKWFLTTNSGISYQCVTYGVTIWYWMRKMSKKAKNRLSRPIYFKQKLFPNIFPEIFSSINSTLPRCLSLAKRRMSALFFSRFWSRVETRK